MIKWRKINDVSDYNMLYNWWQDWGWTTPPTLSMLSKHGYIVSKDGIDTYAGFLYFTGSTIAWVEFIVSNKKATPDQKKGCLNELINVISIIAKEYGATSLFTSSNNQGYINSLKKSGFEIGDTNVIQLTKNI